MWHSCWFKCWWRCQRGGGDIGELQGQSERESSLFQYSLSSSAVCLLTVCLALQIGQKTCAPTNTNVKYQIDTVTVSNMVDHTGDRVLMSRVTCAHAHNYTETRECYSNCTKMLSKTSMWQGNTQKKQAFFEQKITQQSGASAFVRGKHDHVFMVELWTTCQPVTKWQLSVCCALFTQHNTPEREQDQDSNQTLYLRVYLPLTALTELKVLKRSLHVC